MRKIVVKGVTFLYLVGYTRVKIVGPNFVSLAPSCHEVKGVEPNVFERGVWKKTSDGMVTPGELAKWIAKRPELFKEATRETAHLRKQKTGRRYLRHQHA